MCTRRLVASLAVSALAACGSKVSTEFPPGINALQDTIDVAWPNCATGTTTGCASATDPYPDALNTEQGGVNGTGPAYGWAHGRGYLKHPIAEVWATLQLPEVVQLSFYPERDQSTCGGAENVESGYDVSFSTHETPKGIGSFADFIVTFREGVILGTSAAPQEVAVVYQKTWGTTYVGVLAGSIVFRGGVAGSTDPSVPDDPNVTSVELIRHLAAKNTNNGPQTQSWITDYYDELQAYLDGTVASFPVLCSGVN